MSSGDSWTARDVQKLRKMIEQRTPNRIIALKLGRTPEAVYVKTRELGMQVWTGQPPC